MLSINKKFKNCWLLSIQVIMFVFPWNRIENSLNRIESNRFEWFGQVPDRTFELKWVELIVLIVIYFYLHFVKIFTKQHLYCIISLECGVIWLFAMQNDFELRKYGWGYCWWKMLENDSLYKCWCCLLNQGHLRWWQWWTSNEFFKTFRPTNNFLTL